MSRTTPIPILLLAGRDRRKTTVPGGRHVLSGYKAMELQVAGRPLIVHLIERLRETAAFDPIFVAGPAKVYAELAGTGGEATVPLGGPRGEDTVPPGGPRGEATVRLVDTDSTFGENIRAGLEAILAEYPDSHVACITTDVLPEASELRGLVDDFERHLPLNFWVVECRAEDDAALGSSAWKRRYLIRPEGEERVVPALPGHLVIVDPNALRLDLLYRIFELAYRTRNRPTRFRQTYVVRKALMMLVGRDLQRLLALRAPVLTWEMVTNALTLLRKTVTTGIDQREMEERIHRVWVRTSQRKRHPERRGRVLVSDVLSLACDIDTEEEAREIAERMEKNERTKATST